MQIDKKLAMFASWNNVWGREERNEAVKGALFSTGSKGSSWLSAD